jgi:hypothetical protein
MLWVCSNKKQNAWVVVDVAVAVPLSPNPMLRMFVPSHDAAVMVALLSQV